MRTITDMIEQCVEFFDKMGVTWNNTEPGFCPAIFDTVLCWAPAQPNTTVAQPCPKLKGLDEKKSVLKICDVNGKWADRDGQLQNNAYGFTNYTSCFTNEVAELMNSPLLNRNARDSEVQELNYTLPTTLIDDMISEEEKNFQLYRESLFQGPKNLSVLFIAAYCLSILALLFALPMYKKLRPLRSFEHSINFHIMLCVLLTTISAIIAAYQSPLNYSFESDTYGNMILCLIFEYAKSAALTWIALKSVHLHNQFSISCGVTESKTIYYILGYGMSLLNTVAWLAALIVTKHLNAIRYGYRFDHQEFIIVQIYRWVMITVTIISIIAMLKTMLFSSSKLSPEENKALHAKLTILAILIGFVSLPHLLYLKRYTYLRKDAFSNLWHGYVETTFAWQGFFVALIFCIANTVAFHALIDFFRGNKSAQSAQQQQQERLLVNKDILMQA